MCSESCLDDVPFNLQEQWAAKTKILALSPCEAFVEEV